MATIALNIGSTDKAYNLETEEGFIVPVPYVVITSINIMLRDGVYHIDYNYDIYKSSEEKDKSRVNSNLDITTNFKMTPHDFLSDSILELCYDDIVKQIPVAEKIDDGIK